MNFIDTADSYGPSVSEELIAAALYPYPSDLVIVATKGAWCGPALIGGSLTGGRRICVSRARGACGAFRLEQIPLYQFHRPDPAVPLAESLGSIAALKDEGKIRHVGISNVTEDELREAQRIVPDRVRAEQVQHATRTGGRPRWWSTCASRSS